MVIFLVVYIDQMFPVGVADEFIKKKVFYQRYCRLDLIFQNVLKALIKSV